MTERQEYYLGIVLSYIAGAILTIPFFVFIGTCRLFMFICDLAYDTFMFTPRVVTSWQYKHWEKQRKTKINLHRLN